MARPALALVLALAFVPSALAVPVDPQQRFELEQPSGDSFTARPFGDEWYNGRETAAGFTILRNRRSGAWEYAEKGPGGGLRRSGRVVGEDSPAGIARHLRDPDQAARAEDLRQGQEAGPLAEPLEPPALDAAAPLNGGTHPTLVILVQFANQSSLGTTAADWQNRFFGASDSLSDYYDEVSFGNLDIGPATETHGTANDGVVGWLTLPSNHPNTQGNTGTANQQLTADAINAANPYVNFASYDTNHNGLISDDELHITVIPAGWEASAGCGSPAVWGHRWGTGQLSPIVDGVFAGVAYTQFGEKHCDPVGQAGARPARMATLGIIAHEIGHDLDLPDLYDTDNTSYGGVGYWSVMAYGSWLNLPNTDPGTSPPHLNAFEKAYQGWITPTVATDGTKTLLEAAANPAALQVLDNPLGVDWLFRSNVGTGEYFVVENRQRTGYDRAVPGCGLLIWHVNETRSATSPNAIDSARLVALREGDADNYPFEAADPFVGARTFNGTSTPNSDLDNGTDSGVALTSFGSTCASSMSLHVDVPGDTPDPPSGTNGTVTTNEDTAYSLTASSFGFSDPDAGDTFSAVRVDSLPTAGSLTANGGAVTAGSAYAPGALTYTPAANGCGSPYASFTFSVRDSSGTYDPSPNTLTVNVTCVDDPPVAVNDSASLNEDASATTINVRANDTDVDAGTKTITSKTNGAHGTVVITNSGADLTYTPAGNYCGADSFTYTLNGGSTATVNVTVVCVDDRPNAVNDSKTVNEDASATTIDVRANDTDIDGGTKTITGKTNGAHGAVVITNTGADLTYTPVANYCGSDSFTYALNGGSIGIVSVTVTCADDAPTAVNDSPTLDEDALAVTVDVRANDTDVDGGTKTITSKTDGAHGVVAITNSGADLTYTPAADYCGADSFTYALNGGSSATVNITVSCVDDAPVAADDSQTLDEDAVATTIDVRANDTDIDAGPNTIEAKTDGAHGQVAITNSGDDLAYTPEPNHCGTDDFTYTLNGNSTATVNVTVTCVDDAPEAVNDAKEVAKNAVATTVDVLANDTDVDGGSTTIESKTDGAHGTVAINNSGADLTYTPDANYCGADDFTYTLNGGSTGTVDITIPCTDEPPVAVDDSKTVNEDSGATTIDVRANDTDTDGGPKTITSKTNGTHSAVAITNSGDDLTYTPDANYCGADSFTYTLSGGSSATVNVTVSCINDPRVAVNDSATMGEDAPATTIDVLANDTDVDGLPELISAKSDGAHGTVSVALDRSNLTYTPDANYCGTDEFTYLLDGFSVGTVSVTITCVDDKPVAVNDSKTVNEDAAATTIDVRANDTDIDAGTKTVASKSNGSHGTVAITNSGDDLTYTPDGNYCGTDAFTYTLNGGSSAAVNVTVTCIDDAPVAVNDSKALSEATSAAAIDVLANDTDADGGTKKIQSTGHAAHGTVTITNSGDDLTYTPDTGYCGTDSFTYALNGGSSATVNVTVTCAADPDDPPVAVNDTRTVNEDAAATTIDVRANDTNSDGGPKTIQSKTNGAHGAVAITSSGASLTYRPAANYCGGDSFRYTLNGGSSASVTVTVTCVDDAPVAVDDVGAVGEDSWAIFDVRANDTDIDGGTKTIASRTNGAQGVTAITDDGDIAYKPDANYCGSDSFAYTLNGGSTATVSVAVACAPEDSPARDTRPPETTITDGPKRKVKTTRRRAKVTFAFESSEDSSTFLCKLDDGEFKPCGPAKSYRLKHGAHSLWVAAVDAAGNPDTTPIKKRFKVVRIQQDG